MINTTNFVLIIFKKDILALQLMRLFQNIFEQEGLELYLYTYRVIATSPGVSISLIIFKNKNKNICNSVVLLNVYQILVHVKILVEIPKLVYLNIFDICMVKMIQQNFKK